MKFAAFGGLCLWIFKKGAPPVNEQFSEQRMGLGGGSFVDIDITKHGGGRGALFMIDPSLILGCDIG